MNYVTICENTKKIDKIDLTKRKFYKIEEFVVTLIAELCEALFEAVYDRPIACTCKHKDYQSV